MSSRAGAYSRRTSRQQARRQARRTKILTGLVIAAGVLLIGWGIYLFVGAGQANLDAMEYSSADIVYDQPIHAVHEMGEGPPIPFLPRSGPQPALLVPESSYNFGSIGPQEIVERTFVIRNNGEAPLTISRAYTTCGCTQAEITARIIPPGKVAEVTLVFDAGFHDTAGQTVRRGLIMENNDPRHSQAEIWIQASVRDS